MCRCTAIDIRSEAYILNDKAYENHKSSNLETLRYSGAAIRLISKRSCWKLDMKVAQLHGKAALLFMLLFTRHCGKLDLCVHHGSGGIRLIFTHSVSSLTLQTPALGNTDITDDSIRLLFFTPVKEYTTRETFLILAWYALWVRGRYTGSVGILSEACWCWQARTPIVGRGVIRWCSSAFSSVMRSMALTFM